jgi:hypothetical protein
VLPHVDAEQRHVAREPGRVLVRGRVGREPGAVPDEPGPATPESLHAAVAQRGLQLVEAAEGVADRGRELAGRLAAAVRAHDLPEEAVVGVPACVVPDSCLLVVRQDVDGGQHRFHGPVGPFGPGQRRVRIVDVRLVVKVVVDLHRLRVDVRLEGVVGIGKIGQFERHLAAPFAALCGS